MFIVIFDLFHIKLFCLNPIISLVTPAFDRAYSHIETNNGFFHQYPVRITCRDGFVKF